MNYIKKGTMAYNINIIKTDKFKSNVIQVIFRKKIERKDIVYMRLIAEILLESNMRYKNIKEMIRASEDLYGCRNVYNIKMIADEIQMIFQIDYLNDLYTEVGNEEKCINFMNTFLFQPKTEDDGFGKLEFSRAKEKIENEMNLFKEDVESIAERSYYEALYKDSVLKYTNPGYIEDLKTVNEKELYNYYKKLLHSATVDIFVAGNIDEDKLEKQIKTEFKVNTMKKELSRPIVKPENIRKKYKTVVEEKEGVSQSILKMGAKIDNMNEYERKYIGQLYSYILGGSPTSKLNEEVREKNSLCYYVNSSISGASSLLSINSGVDKKNTSKAIKIILKVMKDIENGKFDDKKIEEYKILLRTSYKEIEDSIYSLIGFYKGHEYLDKDLVEDVEKNLEKFSKQQIVDFAKKVKLDTVYILNGVDTNE